MSLVIGRRVTNQEIIATVGLLQLLLTQNEGLLPLFGEKQLIQSVILAVEIRHVGLDARSVVNL